MIKELDSYLPEIQKKYPKIPIEEIKRILEYGFNSYFQLTHLGGDIQISNWRYTAYCGMMFIDNLKRALYNTIKKRIKLRLNYKYSQEVYDGKYYFGLNNSDWEFFISQKNNKRRQKIKFFNLRLYKIKEEAFLDKSKSYFFELCYPVDVGWSFLLEEITTRNFKYIAKRDDKGKIIII